MVPNVGSADSAARLRFQAVNVVHTSTHMSLVLVQGEFSDVVR